MRIKAKQGDLVFIRADDLTTNDLPWVTAEDIKAEHPLSVRIAGFFVGQDKRSVKLSSLVIDDNGHSFGNIVLIPKGAIKEFIIK